MEPDRFQEDILAELIAELPPAPPGWTEAAQELPAARRAMDGIVARAQLDATYRAAVLSDLEAALRAAGHQPTRALVAGLKWRLDA